MALFRCEIFRNEVRIGNVFLIREVPYRGETIVPSEKGLILDLHTYKRSFALKESVLDFSTVLINSDCIRLQAFFYIFSLLKIEFPSGIQNRKKVNRDKLFQAVSSPCHKQGGIMF